MARLWRKDPNTPGGCKYLVLRRDGTVPEWPHFVIGARDPAAPATLRKYAEESRKLGMDPAYCDDVESLANDFEEFRKNFGDGDPDAPRHRKDDPTVIARMVEYQKKLEEKQRNL